MLSRLRSAWLDQSRTGRVLVILIAVGVLAMLGAGVVRVVEGRPFDPKQEPVLPVG